MTIALVSMRAHLRAATDRIHRALHDAAPFAAIAAGHATREEYGATLTKLHAFHAAMAPFCGRGALALGAPRLAGAHATRLAALENDLAHFGLAPRPAPPADVMPEDDFCIGGLYTVQGSTLGGKVIARQLDALLPDDQGRSFFRGGADDGRDWQMLCTRLDAHVGDLTALEAGALHAFRRFAVLVA